MDITENDLRGGVRVVMVKANRKYKAYVMGFPLKKESQQNNMAPPKRN